MSMDKAEETEEPQSKKERKAPFSYDTQSTIEDFANTLLKSLGKMRNKRDAIVTKFFGVPKDKISNLSSSFAMFQRSQAIYALNRFPWVDKRCEIIRITNLSSDEGETTPVYERIRVARKKRASFLTIGEFFLKWKRTKLILELYFCGYQLNAKIFAKSKDMKKANEFQDEITKFMKKNNFLKGENLVYMPRSTLDFLEFPKLTWNDVVLKPEIREEIMLNIIYPISNEKSCIESGIPWRRGLLMGGVAGTGKTQVCRILCSELPKDVTLIWSTPKALYDAEKIQDLFAAARYFSPTVIVIEDIDFIGTSRDFTQNPILGELLTQLDGNDPNHGIFIVATTNRPQQLDAALANRPSRFDVQVEFPLPNTKQRIKLMELFTKEMKFEDGDIKSKFANVSSAANGLTGSHIKEIFVHAQLKAIKRGATKVRMSDVLARVKQCNHKKDKSKQYRG